MQFGTIWFPGKKCVTEKRTYYDISKQIESPLYRVSSQYPLMNYPVQDRCKQFVFDLSARKKREEKKVCLDCP